MKTLSMNSGDQMIRNKFVSVLDNFLAGSLSLSELQNWLLSSLQDIIDSRDTVAIEAANAVDASLIDLGEGQVSTMDFLNQVEASIRSMRTITLSCDDHAEANLTAGAFIRRNSAVVPV